MSRGNVMLAKGTCTSPLPRCPWGPTLQVALLKLVTSGLPVALFFTAHLLILIVWGILAALSIWVPQSPVSMEPWLRAPSVGGAGSNFGTYNVEWELLGSQEWLLPGISTSEKPFSWEPANSKACISWGIEVGYPFPEQSLTSLASPGGIGEAVCAAVSMEPDILVHSLAVQGVPRSGKPSELLDMFGISARHIIVSVKCLLTN